MTRTILIVDDEAEIAEFIADVVEGEALSSLTVQSAKEAINALQQNDICGVITDIVMPDMDGIELLQEIANLGKVMPIVLISGYNHQYLEMAKVIASQQGLTVVGTLTKPFSIDHLTKNISFIKNSLR